MTKVLSEFGEEVEGTPDVLETEDNPAVESAEEYGVEEFPTDIPKPDDMISVQDQNPGFVEGAHT